MVEHRQPGRDARGALGRELHAHARLRLAHCRLPRVRGSTGAVDGAGQIALDRGAERAQALVDPLVAAVDLADVADRRGALGAEARDQHRHPGADVGARQALAVQLRRADHDRAVRVAEDDPRAHRDELVDEERGGSRTSSRRSGSCPAPAWRPRARSTSGRPGTRATGRPRSSGSGRRGRRGSRAPGPAGTRTLSSLELDPDAEPLERRRGSRRGRPAPTSSIVMSPPVTAARPMKLATSMCSGPMRCSPPRELVDALDPEHVRADALDPGAERDEEPAEILDVRLAGRVHQHGLALGASDGGHDRVLGRHHARLVEEDPLPAEPRRRAARSGGRPRSRRRAPRTRGCAVSSRRRPIKSPPGGEHASTCPQRAPAAGPRAGTRRGSARESASSTSVRVICSAWTRTSFGPVHSASAPRSPSSATIVSTSRIRGMFREHDRLVGQQARGEDRQGAVLVAGRADAAARAAGRPRSRTTRLWCL